MSIQKEKRLARWYFGGLSSAFAACCTHPLDLLKVHLQTQQEVKLTLVQMARNVIKTQGKLYTLYKLSINSFQLNRIFCSLQWSLSFTFKTVDILDDAFRYLRSC